MAQEPTAADIERWLKEEGVQPHLEEKDLEEIRAYEKSSPGGEKDGHSHPLQPPRNPSTLYNRSGTFTFSTLVENLLPPEKRCGDGEEVAEALLEVRNVNLESIGLKSTAVLECLGSNVTHMYLQHNEIEDLDGLEFFSSLSVLAVSHNRIRSLAQVSHLPITLLDASYNLIAAPFNADEELPSATLRSLNLVGNPLCDEDKDTYKKVILCACSSLLNLDGEDVSNEERRRLGAPENPDYFVTETGDEEEAPVSAIVDDTLKKEVEGTGAVDAAPAARYEFEEGTTSNVRHVTDQLLQQYEEKMKEKAGALNDLMEGDNSEDDENLQHACTTQKALREDLRFAQEHQGRLAQARLEGAWQDGASQLRVARENGSERRFRFAEQAAEHSPAYLRALELLQKEAQCDNLDKYRKPGGGK